MGKKCFKNDPNLSSLSKSAPKVKLYKKGPLWMVGVIPGFTLVQKKPRLSLVSDENWTLFSTDLEANVLNLKKNNGKNS
jgi:hypothetical protein